MILVNDSKYRAANAWGQVQSVRDIRYEVERSDIGRIRHSYLGRGYRDYTFTAADVGKIISHISSAENDSGCWSFVTNS